MSDKKRILWVEDDVDYQDEMRGSFKQQFELTFVTNEKDAKILLKGNTPDLVIVDLKLLGRKKAGEALIKEISGLYPTLPIIIVSAGKVKEMRRAQDMGAKEILSKDEIDIEEWTTLFKKYARPAVFLSHNSVDKPFVRRLKKALDPHCSAWLDEDEIGIGDSIDIRVEEGLEIASVFIIIITPEAIESGWVRGELQKAYEKLKRANGKILPIKLRECKLPVKISDLKYSDCTELSDFQVDKGEDIFKMMNDFEKLCEEKFQEIIAAL